LWFAEFTGNAVSSITTSGVVTRYPLPNVNSHPNGVTTDAAKTTVWFTEFQGDRIGNLTP